MDKVYFRVTYDDGSISFYSSIAYLQTPYRYHALAFIDEMAAKLQAGVLSRIFGPNFEVDSHD